jgi:hypothetical protein
MHAAFVLAAVSAALVASPGCKRTRLPPKPDGAAVVVEPIEPAAEVGFTMADEVEPNDLLANAQPLAPTAEAGAGVVGRLLSPPGSKAKDIDLFRVTVPPAAVVVAGPDGAVPPPLQQLRIEVHPDPGLLLAVDVVDDQGRIAISSTGSTPGEVQGIPNLAVAAGPVFVRVRPGFVPGGGGAAAGVSTRADAGASGSGGGYRLTVRIVPVGPGDEIEPNGKGILANEASLEGDVAGYLGWRHDEDWFRIPTAGMAEGGVLSADLDGIEGVAAALAVYDSVQHKMIEQHGRKGDRVALRNVRLPSSDPNVFVVVSADSGRNLDARYTLHLRSEEAKADVEIEPNDDPAHAVPIVDGTVTGTLGPGDADVFRYSATVPTELNVEVQPPPHIDVRLEVLREDGTSIMKVDAAKRGGAERLPNLFVSGTVLLRLQGQKGAGNLDDPYRLNVSGRPIEAGAEHEPNGSAALASPLPTATTGTGLIFPRGDVDYWTSSATTGGPAADSVSIATRGVPGMTLEVRVQTTATGKEITRFRVGGDGSAPTRIPTGPDGCCLLEIREVTGRASNPKDRYSLSVTP